MQLIKNRLNQRGDTIVEVLIAIAVISTILGGAYATANRNVKTEQQTQEHSEAQKVAEGQLEQLRGLASSDPDALSAAPINTGAASNTFCMQSGAGTGAPCTIGRYSVTVNRTGTLYVAQIRWDSINGGTDQVDLRYRIAP